MTRSMEDLALILRIGQHIKIESTPIHVGKGILVSESSYASYSPELAVQWAIQRHSAPLVTADEAVLTRFTLDWYPCDYVGLDHSDGVQRVSDVCGFYNHKKMGLWLAVSDLPTMYEGENLNDQLDAAKRIGWGVDLAKKDDIVQRILDTSGKRKARVPGSYRGIGRYHVPLARYGNDKIALAFLPEESRTNAGYISSKRLFGEHRTSGFFDLLGSDISGGLEEGKTVAVRSCWLGSAGYDYGIYARAADFGYQMGLARASIKGYRK